MIRHRLPLLLAPVLASLGVLSCRHRLALLNAWLELRTQQHVCQDVENKEDAARTPDSVKGNDDVPTH